MSRDRSVGCHHGGIAGCFRTVGFRLTNYRAEEHQNYGVDVLTYHKFSRHYRQCTEGKGDFFGWMERGRSLL
jgi:hypothetical protein